MFAGAVGKMGLLRKTSPLGPVDAVPIHGHSHIGETVKHTHIHTDSHIGGVTVKYSYLLQQYQWGETKPLRTYEINVKETCIN